MSYQRDSSKDGKKKTALQKRGRKKGTRRYTDEQLFALWQQGKSDAKIGAVVGVSHTVIQRWRDEMELPSHYQNHVDTHNYKLVNTEYGIYAVYEPPGSDS